MNSRENDELKKLHKLIFEYYKKMGEGKYIDVDYTNVTVESITEVFKHLMNEVQKYRQELEDTSLMMDANLEEISNTYDLLSSLLEITDVLSKSVNPYDVALEVVSIIQKNVPSEEAALFVLENGNIKEFSKTGTKRSRIFFNSYMLINSHKAVLDEKVPLMAIPIETEKDFYGAFVCVGKKNGSFYNAADRKLIESAAKQLRIAFSNYKYFRAELKRAAVQKELSIAHKIQQSLFPKKFPENFKVAGTSIPAHDVGGDYYDAFELNGKLFIVVADVSGKGVPAAIIMSSFRSYLKGIVHSGMPFEELVNYLNHLISSDIAEDRFVTAVVGTLDPSTNTFEYVNAGHDPIIRSRNGNLDFFESNGIPFGIMDSPEMYKSEKVKMNKDDIIVIYTDGIAEARNFDKEEYGLSRIYDFVRNFNDLPPRDMLEMLIENVADFSHGTEQHDDMTALIAKI